MVDIRNESCIDTMQALPLHSIDIVLTSPFYNTNKKARKTRTLNNTSVASGQYNYVRYDTHVDNMTDEEYCDFTVTLFNGFDRILSENGSVLYNICYGGGEHRGNVPSGHGDFRTNSFHYRRCDCVEEIIRISQCMLVKQAHKNMGVCVCVLPEKRNQNI